MFFKWRASCAAFTSSSSTPVTAVPPLRRQLLSIVNISNRPLRSGITCELALSTNRSTGSVRFVRVFSFRKLRKTRSETTHENKILKTGKTINEIFNNKKTTPIFGNIFCYYYYFTVNIFRSLSNDDGGGGNERGPSLLVLRPTAVKRLKMKMKKKPPHAATTVATATAAAARRRHSRRKRRRRRRRRRRRLRVRSVDTKKKKNCLLATTDLVFITYSNLKCIVFSILFS